MEETVQLVLKLKGDTSKYMEVETKICGIILFLSE